MVDLDALQASVQARLVRLERLGVEETEMAYQLAWVVASNHLPGSIYQASAGPMQLCNSCGESWPCAQIKALHDWLG